MDNNLISLFLITIFFTWFISQGLKYIFKRKLPYKHLEKKLLINTFLFYSGPPSAHTSSLIASGLFLGHFFGYNSGFFIIAIMFNIFWLFEIIMQRKRFNQLVIFLKHGKFSKHDFMKMKEFYGHDIRDVLYGILVGVLSFLFLNSFLF